MRLLALLIALPSLFLAAPVAAKQVNLDVRLSNPVMPADKKHTVFLKVGLTGFEMEKSGERTPANVAIVLDKSGSMSGQKIRKAKEAARMAVDRLGDDDIVSVVAYDHTVRVLVPATKVSDKEAIRQGIDRLSPGGNTALFAGVSKGADEVGKFLDKNRVNRVILLSDGLANVGPASPNELASLGEALGRRGISVTTLGLGLDYNEDLMSRLARASDGNHAFVERAADLTRFFNLEFGDVLSVVAQEVTIRVKCAPGVRPVRVLGREADIVGQEVTGRINQIIARREKFLMLELEVPASEHGAERDIVEVNVDYGNMLTKTTDRLSAKVRGTFSRSPKEVGRREDKSVMIEAVGLVATEKNRMAVTLRDEGKVKEAREVLFQNSLYLDSNSALYKSPKLKTLSKDNKEDAKNLDEANWGRQRKKMRRQQYKFDMQQSY